jgi:hypothetical protein
MTRHDHIQHAVLAALARHEGALNAAVGVSSLRIDIKFDRSTTLACKAILHLEMENFLAVKNKRFDFSEECSTVKA